MIYFAVGFNHADDVIKDIGIFLKSIKKRGRIMKLKKLLRALVSLVLVVTLFMGTCTNAFAATARGNKYIKEVIISYGNTADEAKNWLIDNGYEVLDYNLNEGADDTFSTARAVYLGYTTTDDADEAITDMKLMNMKGGYSVKDYQMLLSEQEDNIKVFFDNFKVAINEYRANYNAGQERAIAAHDLLNMLYDDDTQQNLGDLLLNKVKEEYTDEEFAALSAEEQAKAADMTTILMQANGNAILVMEQLIAMATDDGDTLWTIRYQEAKTYDEMLDELMQSKNLTVSEAEKQLAAEYDEDAKKIAANFENYKSYLEKYTNSGITIDNTAEEIEAYANANEDFSYSDWCAIGTQYELLKDLENNDISLLDLITSDEYDVENDDRYMLYPLVASLTKGQRACLDFLSTYQLVALGINDNDTVKASMEEIGITSIEGLQNVSIYEGVDRSIFGGDVALTGEAYRLQNSSGKSVYGEDDSSVISTTSIVLYSTFAVSTAMTVFSWVYSPHLDQLSLRFYDEMNKAKYYTKLVGENLEKLKTELKSLTDPADIADQTARINEEQELLDKAIAERKEAIAAYKSTSYWSKIMFYAKIGITCATIVLFAASLWSTYEDLKEYYNAEFTPIPSNMVNQGVNENSEKVYTYYSAVKCNRVAQGMVTDSTKILGDFGDLNGDVGRQWLALYTTKDSSAGNPITTDFTVQYNNTNIPNESTALSIFCESTAQNLTNKKAGYTYADSKDGIYLFYGTDSNAFAGSIFSNGKYIMVGGISALVAAVIAFVVGEIFGNKKLKKKKKAATT